MKKSGQRTQIAALGNVLEVCQGGTGKKTAWAGLTALGGIHRNTLGAANGVLALTEGGLINSTNVQNALANQVTLSGDREIIFGQDAHVYISNFDMESNYAASSSDIDVTFDPTAVRHFREYPGESGGTLAQINEVSIDDLAFRTITLSLTNPSFINPLQLVVSRNAVERVVELTGIVPGVVSPEFAVLKENNLIPCQYPEVQLKTFRTYPADSDLHTATDWQLSYDRNGSTVFWQSANDRLDKYTKRLPVKLPPNQTVYLRVAFRGAKSGLSPWRVVKLITDVQ